MLKALIAPISNLLDKLIPDADKRQEAKIRLAELSSKSDTLLCDIAKNAMAAANQLNLVDANSNDKYRTRWRPTIGWVCVIALAWEFVLRPFVISALVIFHPEGGNIAPLIPSLDLPAILGLVATLLGMGTMRTAEKRAGLT